MILLGTSIGLFMMWGKDNIINILERDLQKERRQFALCGGSGKDCMVNVHFNPENKISILFCDMSKAVLFELPDTVLVDNIV